jgi:hypothetical protein
MASAILSERTGGCQPHGDQRRPKYRCTSFALDLGNWHTAVPLPVTSEGPGGWGSLMEETKKGRPRDGTGWGRPLEKIPRESLTTTRGTTLPDGNIAKRRATEPSGPIPTSFYETGNKVDVTSILVCRRLAQSRWSVRANLHRIEGVPSYEAIHRIRHASERCHGVLDRLRQEGRSQEDNHRVHARRDDQDDRFHQGPNERRESSSGREVNCLSVIKEPHRQPVGFFMRQTSTQRRRGL